MANDDARTHETPGRPSPGPQRITPYDRALVEWVANASVGDKIPEPWKWASSPTQSVILRLVDLRVIKAPAQGTDNGDVVREAAVAARAWLEAHPRVIDDPLRVDESGSRPASG